MAGFALITGASVGLGRELAQLYAADRRDVILVARSEDKLRALAAQLSTEHGVRAEVLAADLAQPGAARRVFEEVERRGLLVDDLVNNAGLGACGAFWELEEQREVDQIQVNVTALVHLTRLFLPGMVQRRRGRVLNIASTAGFQPGPYMATYYATKAFVVSFSEAIAHELRDTGVRVTCHCPGATATEFARTAGNDKTLLFKAGVADARVVARHAYRAVGRGSLLAIPGVVNWLGAFSVRFAPRAVTRWLAARVNT
jgi:short-subunit dehydrogenase